MICLLNFFQFMLGFFEIFLCFKMLQKIFEIRDKMSIKTFFVWGIIAVLAIVENINRNIRLYSIILIIFLIISISISFSILYKTKFLNVLLCTSFYCFSLELLDLFIIFTMGVILKESDLGIYIGRNISFERICALSFGRILLFLLYMCILKIKEFNIIKYKKAITIILLAEIIGVYYFQVIYAGGSIAELSRTYFAYLTIVILITISFGIYTIYRDAIEESKIVKLRTTMLEQNYLHLKLYFEDSRTLFHDYKAHITLLRRYLSDGDIKKAHEYIERISEPILNLENQVNTGHETLDLIMNYKLAEVKEKQINLKYNISFIDSNSLEIEEGDLFVILYNLLDNAIEACEKITSGEKWIELSIQNINKMFMISIKNSMQIRPYYKNGIIISSKKDKHYHGIGMSSVKRLVDKYNGHFEYSSTQNIFEVNITLF